MIKKFKLKNLLTKELLVLYVIVLLGAFLRFQGVFTLSFAFTYDVGRDMIAVASIVNNHKLPLIGATTGLPGVFYGPWWYYLLVPFFVISLGNPQGIAVAMAGIGIVSVILGFILGKKIEGDLLGLTFAGFLAVSPVMVSLSSQIWNPDIAPFFVLLTLLVLYQIFSQKESKSYLYLFLGLLLGLCFDIEIVFGLLFSLGMIISLVLIKFKKIKIMDVVCLICGGLIILSPRIVFELRHNFLMTQSFIHFIFSKDSTQSGLSLLGLLTNRVNVLFDLFNSTIAVENKILGLILILVPAIYCFTLFKKMKTKTKSFVILCVVSILVFLIGTVLFKHDIWPHYLVGLPVIFLLLLSISLSTLTNKQDVFIVGTISCLIFLLNMNLVAMVDSVSKPIWTGDASVYRNQVEVVEYIYHDAKNTPFKYVVYTPPLYDYSYQYLFEWYGPKEYGFAPTIQAHLAYFILEPDVQYPSRLYDWLKSREKDGKITQTKNFKSGIIVQKRIH